VGRTVTLLAKSVFVASCSLVVFLAWGVLSEERPARAQTTGTCPNAQFIDTFEGTGDQQTDTFNTTTNSLHITFNVTDTDPGPASLSIYVIDANDPDQLSVGNASQDGDGQGETFVNAPAGTYFLDIGFFSLGNGGQYTITVEQCEGGNPSRNPNPGGGGAAPVQAPAQAPVRDQYASKRLPPRTPPGNVRNPRDVIPSGGVRRMPPTGGPPYLAVGALALLGTALVVGRGVLKR
jgi:hypothetical protein